MKKNSKTKKLRELKSNLTISISTKMQSKLKGGRAGLPKVGQLTV